MSALLAVTGIKNKDGSVAIWRQGGESLRDYQPWVTYAAHRADKPDYRHKYITLNCYRYLLMWDKRGDKP